MKRRICQSLVDLGCPKATLRSAKTRRLRFPFFKTTCQRAATRAVIPADPTRSTLETANSVPVTRPEARYLRLRAMPVEGGEARQCVATGRNKYQPRPGVNTLVKKSWGARQLSCKLLVRKDSFCGPRCGSRRSAALRHPSDRPTAFRITEEHAIRPHPAGAAARPTTWLDSQEFGLCPNSLEAEIRVRPKER